MTISRVSSSDNLYIPQAQASPWTENIIHTWHLAEGNRAYLIRKDDKLECIFVKGENSFIFGIPVPSSTTPEEAIDYLLEMYPIYTKNNSIKFIEDAELLHTWDVKYGIPIDLIRIGEDLKCKTALDDNQIQVNILTPDGLFLEERIEWVMQRHPHVYIRKDKYVVEFEEKVKTETSAVDGKTPLDMDHWCVTMLNSDTSGVWDACSPDNWMGHSLTVIETIEEGGYFSRRADLIQQNGKANVRFFEIDRNKTKEQSKNYSKTETFSRPKEDVQRMLDKIWLNVCDQKEGKPSVFFKIDGDKRPFWERFYAINDLTDLTELNEGNYVANCTKYSVDNMAVANIKPSSGYALSNEVFKTPVLYTESIGSKVKAVMQEALMMTLQTGLYSGVSSFAAWSLVGTSFATLATTTSAAFIVGGPIAAGSVWAGGFIGTICGGSVGWWVPAAFVKSKMVAASIGAVGGGIAGLAQIVMKYEKADSKNDLNLERLRFQDSINDLERLRFQHSINERLRFRSMNRKKVKPSILEEGKKI